DRANRKIHRCCSTSKSHVAPEKSPCSQFPVDVYRPSMLRGLALVAGTLALAAPASRPFPHVAGCVRADFRSAGTTVRAERCGAASGDRAAIVFHGCGGFDTFDHRLA